jgi:G3E family GTPase
MTAAQFDVIPVNILTGFLGSGKTTLLNEILHDRAFEDTAVLINEFGAVGLDHLLVAEVAPNTVLLANGCLCCSVNGEFTAALVNLFEARSRGTIPNFQRVIVETTGIATPGPLIASILNDPVVRHHYRMGITVAVVDAVNASFQSERHPEWIAQVCAADRIVLSKTDLVTAEEAENTDAWIRGLNPVAEIVPRTLGETGADSFLDAGLAGNDPTAEVVKWFPRREKLLNGSYGASAFHRADQSTPPLQAACMVLDKQVNWVSFSLWLSMLLHRHGDKILRVKGLLDIAGAEAPVALHGVHHLIHPPVHLRSWPNENRRSQLVFITEGISEDELVCSFKRFCDHLDDADLP